MSARRSSASGATARCTVLRPGDQQRAARGHACACGTRSGRWRRSRASPSSSGPCANVRSSPTASARSRPASRSGPRGLDPRLLALTTFLLLDELRRTGRSSATGVPAIEDAWAPCRATAHSDGSNDETSAHVGIRSDIPYPLASTDRKMPERVRVLLPGEEVSAVGRGTRAHRLNRGHHRCRGRSGCWPRCGGRGYWPREPGLADTSPWS